MTFKDERSFVARVGCEFLTLLALSGQCSEVKGRNLDDLLEPAEGLHCLGDQRFCACASLIKHRSI